jgi:hypothetical protein
VDAVPYGLLGLACAVTLAALISMQRSRYGQVGQGEVPARR